MRLFRQGVQLSQREAARSFGISRVLLAHFEVGTRPVSIMLLEKMAQTYHRSFI